MNSNLISLDEVVALLYAQEETVTQQHAGSSIIELINEEINRSSGDYRNGLEHALFTIEEANRTGRKPFYALKSAWSEACAGRETFEFRRGIKTVQFIFETPYKWINGERV